MHPQILHVKNLMPALDVRFFWVFKQALKAMSFLTSTAKKYACQEMFNLMRRVSLFYHPAKLLNLIPNISAQNQPLIMTPAQQAPPHLSLSHLLFTYPQTHLLPIAIPSCLPHHKLVNLHLSHRTTNSLSHKILMLQT